MLHLEYSVFHYILPAHFITATKCNKVTLQRFNDYIKRALKKSRPDSIHANT